MKRSSERPVILYYLLALVILLLLSEVALRVYFRLEGYHVGSLAPGWQPVRKVDSLVTEHSFYTDSTGIFKADAQYWTGHGMHINGDGFRGAEFTKDPAHPGLLLLGDSFTWGSAAQPFDSSFADILSRRGFTVYNTGIPGADPAQYALVADSFLPKLHPKYTAVFFYVGNDMMNEDRTPAPGRNIYYITNTGWLSANYNNRYFPSSQASYQYYLDLYTPKSILGKLMTHTALGTLLLSLPLRLQERKAWQEGKEMSISNRHLQHISQLCDRNGSQLFIFVIPYSGSDMNPDYFKDPQKYILDEYTVQFKGLENKTYALPMRKTDYLPLPNGHFNNSGHKRAADFVKRTLIMHP